MPPKKQQNEPKKKKATVEDKTVSYTEITGPTLTQNPSTHLALFRYSNLNT